MKRDLSLLWIGVLAVGLLAFITGAAFAQQSGKVKREQVKAYVQENVLPVVIEQRLKFEANLTAEEIAEIAELRTRMQGLRGDVTPGQRREEFRQKRTAGERPELTEEQKTERREKMKERRKIMMAAFEIADNHEAELEALFDEMREDAQEWKADMRAILEDGIAERRRDFAQKRRGRGHGKLGLMHMMRPVGFILLDPANAEEQLQQLDDGKANLYPNPVNNVVNLQFTVPKREIVAITLYDDQGAPVKVLSNEVREKGNHNLSFDMVALPSGTYFYEIQGVSISENHRVVKQ